MPEVLLDTHALLWWQSEPAKLSRRASQAINGADAVLISPISCWELAMLVAKGRIVLDRPTAAWVHDALDRPVAREAPLTPAIAAASAELAGFHGDPADRFLYATAAATKAAFVTRDAKMRDYAKAERTVVTIW